MSFSVAIGAVALLVVLAWWFGRQRGLLFAGHARGEVGAVHSLPQYHGAYVAVLALLPAVAVLALWARWPFLLVVVLGAAAAGVVRWWG